MTMTKTKTIVAAKSAPQGKLGPKPPKGAARRRILVSERDKARIFAAARRNGVAYATLVDTRGCMCLVGHVADVQLGNPKFGYGVLDVAANGRESEASLLRRAKMGDVGDHGWVTHNDRWLRSVLGLNSSLRVDPMASATKDPRIIEAWIDEVASKALTTKPPLTRRVRKALRDRTKGQG